MGLDSSWAHSCALGKGTLCWRRYPSSRLSLIPNSQAARVVYVFSLGLSLGFTMDCGTIRPEHVLRNRGCCGLAASFPRGPSCALLALPAFVPRGHPRRLRLPTPLLQEDLLGFLGLAPARSAPMPRALRRPVRYRIWKYKFSAD